MSKKIKNNYVQLISKHSHLLWSFFIFIFLILSVFIFKPYLNNEYTIAQTLTPPELGFPPDVVLMLHGDNAFQNFRDSSSFNKTVAFTGGVTQTLYPIQDIFTDTVTDIEEFTISSTTYIAVADSASTSKIYQWDASTLNLIKIQDITTNSARDIEPFEIAGETYIVIAQTNPSRIYRWNTSTSQFDIFVQDIAVTVQDWESITIGSDVYIVNAAYAIQSTAIVTSRMYRWNSGTSQFDQVQTFSTTSVWEWETFEIAGEIYLAASLRSYSGGSGSRIYKWDGATFVYDSAVVGAVDLEIFTIGSDTFLAAATYPTVSSNQRIYRWNGSSFAQIQTIPISGSTKWESFVLNGNTYLVLSGQSNIYEWDGATFVLVQSIGVGSGLSESFVANGETYLMLNNASPAKVFRFGIDKKFGNSSIIFDGAGDYLSVAANDDWNFGDDDLTIDMWINIGDDRTASGTQALVDSRDSESGNNGLFFNLNENKVGSDLNPNNNLNEFTRPVSTWAEYGIYNGTCTQQVQNVTIPSDCSRLRVKTWGAGGRSSATNGGGGGYAQATIPVTPGDIYTYIVGCTGGTVSVCGGTGNGGFGGGGSGGCDMPGSGGAGAGGGGATTFFANISSATTFDLGNGVDNINLTPLVSAGGGGAGSASGSTRAGGAGGSDPALTPPISYSSGETGSSTAAGRGSYINGACPGNDGEFGKGGGGGERGNWQSGGGGGGGFYGGGGGRCNGGAGGGGSNYLNNSVTSIVNIAGDWENGADSGETLYDLSAVGDANQHGYIAIECVLENPWHHLALVKSQDTVFHFIDGDLVGDWSYSDTVGYNNESFLIGAQFDLDINRWFDGYIDELRVLKGRAAWTSNFTPSTKAYEGLPYITGTTTIGQTLTGNYIYSDEENDPEGASICSWYRSASSTLPFTQWDFIASSTCATSTSGIGSSTYSLVLDDVDSYINFEVTPVSVNLPYIGSSSVSEVVGPVLSAKPEVNVDKNTVLLIHSNSTYNLSTFIDSSWGGVDSPHAINNLSNVIHSTTYNKFWDTSLYFDYDRIDDRLQIADSDDFTLAAAEDYTIDFWINTTASRNDSGPDALFSTGNYTGANNIAILLDGTDHDQPQVYIGGNAQIISSFSVNDGQWHHIALVRASNDFKLYIDGEQKGSTYNSGAEYNGSGFWLGWTDASTTFYGGYMDEFRISKGIARWTSDFNTPSTPRPGPYIYDATTATTELIGYYEYFDLDDYYSNTEREGGSICQWYSLAASSTPITASFPDSILATSTLCATSTSNIGSSTYELQYPDDVNRYFQFAVIPYSQNAPYVGATTTSLVVGPVEAIKAPLAYSTSLIFDQDPFEKTNIWIASNVGSYNDPSTDFVDYTDGDRGILYVGDLLDNNMTPGTYSYWATAQNTPNATLTVRLPDVELVGGIKLYNANGYASESDYTIEYSIDTTDGFDGTWIQETSGNITNGGVREIPFSELRNIQYFRINLTRVSASYGIITLNEIEVYPPGFVEITGSTTVEQTLTGNYTYYDEENDPEGASICQWYSLVASSTLITASFPDSILATSTPCATSTPGNGTSTFDLRYTQDIDRYFQFAVIPYSQNIPYVGSTSISIVIGPVNDEPEVIAATSSADYINNTNNVDFNIACSGVSDLNGTNTPANAQILTLSYSFNNGSNWYILGTTTSPVDDYTYSANIDLEDANPTGYTNDGEKTIICQVDDGLAIATSSSLTISKDTNPPTITDNYAYDNIWASSTQTITLSPTDTGGSGILETRYCFGTTCNTASGTVGTLINVSTSTNDTLRYQTWDNSGNESAIGSTTIRIDLQAPTITDDYVYDNIWASSTQTITFSTADTGGSGILETRYCFGASCNLASGTIGTSTNITTDTNNTLRYQTWDNAGNALIGSTTVKIDLTPPAPEIDYFNGYATTTFATINVVNADGNVDPLRNSGPSNNPLDYYLEYRQTTLTLGVCDVGSYSSWQDTLVSEGPATTSYSFNISPGFCYQFQYTMRDMVGYRATATSSNTLISGWYPEARNLSITGTLLSGQTLTGSYEYYDGDSDPQASSTIIWATRSAVGGGAPYSVVSSTTFGIIGTTTWTYTITNDDLGRTIEFEVCPISQNPPYNGTCVSTSTGALSGEIPEITNISIIGTTTNGQILTGSYVYFDNEGDNQSSSTIRWLRSNTEFGTYTEIPGTRTDFISNGSATSTYTLTGSDTYNYIRFEVVPISVYSPYSDEVGISSSTTIGPIGGVEPEVISIGATGNPRESQTLRFNYTYQDIDSDTQATSTLRIYRSDQMALVNGVIEAPVYSSYPANPIFITNYPTEGQEFIDYPVSTADVQRYLRFEVTPVSINTPYTGTPTSTEIFIFGSAPIASNVRVGGLTIEDETLYGEYDYYDADGNAQASSTFQWYISNVSYPTGNPNSPTTVWNAIPGATSTNFTVPLTLGALNFENYYLKFEVTPISATGTPNIGSSTRSMVKGPVVQITVDDGYASVDRLSETLLPISNTQVGEATIFGDSTEIRMRTDQRLQCGQKAPSTINEIPTSTMSVGDAISAITGESFTKNVRKVTFYSGRSETIKILSTDDLEIEIPHETTVYAEEAWDCTIMPPVDSPTSATIAGSQIVSPIRVGNPGIALLLDKPAKVTIPDTIGVPYYSIDGVRWARVLTECDSALGGGYVFPGNCYFKDEVNGETIIWTYHFSEYGLSADSLGLRLQHYGNEIIFSESIATTSVQVIIDGERRNVGIVETSSPYASDWRILLDGEVRALQEFK